MREQLRTCVLGMCLFWLSAGGTAQGTFLSQANAVSERLGFPPEVRLLVIQTEDLGMAHSIDKASFEALEKGWVTTAGILVPGPWFPEVLRWSHNHPNADLGIGST